MDLLVDLLGLLRRRRLIIACSILMVGFVGCGGDDRTSGLEGESAQLAMIKGASMFPSIPGNHYRLKCQQCSFHFEVDADNMPRQRVFACPNCGCQDVALGLTEKKPSELFTLKPHGDQIARWDIVGFKIPKHLRSGGNIGLKRVVGLPNEEIRISGGEILVNGQIAECEFAQKRKALIEVHDNQFLQLDNKPRWTASAGWEKVGRDWNYDPNSGSSKYSWLEFVPVQNFRRGSAKSASLVDSYGCNQNLSRSLNNVRDLLLEIRITPSRRTRLCAVFESGQDVMTATFDFTSNSVSVEFGARARRWACLYSGLAIRSPSRSRTLTDRPSYLLMASWC